MTWILGTKPSSFCVYQPSLYPFDIAGYSWNSFSSEVVLFSMDITMLSLTGSLAPGTCSLLIRSWSDLGNIVIEPGKHLAVPAMQCSQIGYLVFCYLVPGWLADDFPAPCLWAAVEHEEILRDNIDS